MNLRILIAAGVVAAYGCGSTSTTTPSTPSPTTPPTTTGTPVSIVSGSSFLTNTAYSPNPVTVAVGGSVTWVNNDSTTHTSISDTGAWNSGVIAPGGTFTMTFPSAGAFPYHCQIHPGMVGMVNVQ